jgi:hypothetical protein
MGTASKSEAIGPFDEIRRDAQPYGMPELLQFDRQRKRGLYVAPRSDGCQ